MRVCFISNSLRIGGAERVLLETVDVLKEQGLECLVLVPGEGPFSEELSRRAIAYRIAFSSWLALLPLPTVWQRCKSALRFVIATLSAMNHIARGQYDVVYSNTVRVGHGALAAKLLNKVHIWHLHEFTNPFHFYFGKNFSCRIVGALSDITIVVSKAMATSYGKFIEPSKVTMVYPSLHLELIPVSESGSLTPAVFPRRRDMFRCTIVGGICPGKGQEDAVRAIALLRQQDVGVELLIVGANEDLQYRNKLNEIVEEHHMEDVVLFTGELRDAHILVESSDVLLVCSRSEGFGRVTIEAMLACIPVIGTARDATAELIQENFNGMLYEVADVDGLAERVLYLYRNPDVARQFGQRGGRWAAEIFNKARYSAEIMRIINKTVKQKSVGFEQ